MKNIENIETFKMHRLGNNPKEKEMLVKFTTNHMAHNDIDRIVFGTVDGMEVARYLDDNEKRIVLSTIQWLGSAVGKAYLRECGFRETHV
jgi:hypothetical protein